MSEHPNFASSATVVWKSGFLILAALREKHNSEDCVALLHSVKAETLCNFDFSVHFEGRSTFTVPDNDLAIIIKDKWKGATLSNRKKEKRLAFTRDVVRVRITYIEWSKKNKGGRNALITKKKKGRTSETPLLSETIKQNNTKKKKQPASGMHGQQRKKAPIYIEVRQSLEKQMLKKSTLNQRPLVGRRVGKPDTT